MGIIKLLITGCAGFIGYHLCQKLLGSGLEVIGIDNLTPYYQVKLKRDRLQQLTQNSNFTYYQFDIQDVESLGRLFEVHKIPTVVNLAGQAGVRHSIDNPNAHIQSNIIGFFNILEVCRYHQIEHLVYASSSSVYGLNSKIPLV